MRKEHNFLNLLKENLGGILVAVLIGLLGYAIRAITKFPVADPLLISMLIGIIVRTAIRESSKLKAGFNFALRISIPIGVIFYAAKNLNFIKYREVEINMIILLMIIILVYFAVILILGRLMGQNKKITYLTATGSAICGASAIVITAPAVEAEADDVSISLLSVALAAFVGLFMILPFLATLMSLTDKMYGVLSGSVLQFTGFVKVAVAKVSFLPGKIPAKELASLALSIKAVRYLGLLIAIPLFASMTKRKIYLPWFLWAFLGAGLFGTWLYATNKTFYVESMIPFVKPIYGISWSIAMAAIGLNADIKQLLSNNGTKALVMAFLGFIAAIVTFFIGLKIIRFL